MERHEYTFIRRQVTSLNGARRAATDAVVIMRFAAQGDPAIAIDRIMEADDVRCAIVISVSDIEAMRAFDRRIQIACDALGLTFSKRGATPVRASSSERGGPGESFAHLAWAG